MPETFRIQAVPGDGECTLILTGEIDLAVAPDLVQLGTISLNEPDTKSLVVDLAGVTFIDSTAIGALIRLRNLALDADKHLALSKTPTRVNRVLATAGLDGIFDTTD